MFTWDNFDTNFVKEILKASDRAEEFRDFYESEDIDKEALISCINTICDKPDKGFIQKYRTIIDNELLKKYPDEVNKICRAMRITGSNYNERQINMCKKELSNSLLREYAAAIYRISGGDYEVGEYDKFRSTIHIKF